MMINPTYAQPILNLANLCSKYDIPFSIHVVNDGMQLRFPWINGDIACNCLTYSCDYGLVESYNCPWDEGDEKVSCLEVETAFTLLVDWYARSKD